MDIETAASALLQKLALPREAVSVLVWHEANETRLVVWVSPTWIDRMKWVPDSFEGYAVQVERRPMITNLYDLYA
jgi:hypothetical protein